MCHLPARHLHDRKMLLDDDWLAAQQAGMPAGAIARLAVEDRRRPRRLSETALCSLAACHFRGSSCRTWIWCEW
jgi:hypothetical protein